MVVCHRQRYSDCSVPVLKILGALKSIIRCVQTHKAGYHYKDILPSGRKYLSISVYFLHNCPCCNLLANLRFEIFSPP